MVNYVVYIENGSNIELLTKKWRNGETINTISLKSFKRIDDIINSVKTFTDSDVKEMCKENLSLKSMPLFNFIQIIHKLKCKCSDECMNFVYGGFYNIPDVGGVCVECYDRISKNGKLTPYKVMKLLRKY